MGHTACGQQIQSNTSKVGYAAGGQYLSSRYSGRDCEQCGLITEKALAPYVMSRAICLAWQDIVSKL